MSDQTREQMLRDIAELGEVLRSYKSGDMDITASVGRLRSLLTTARQEAVREFAERLVKDFESHGRAAINLNAPLEISVNRAIEFTQDALQAFLKEQGEK